MIASSAVVAQFHRSDGAAQAEPNELAGLGEIRTISGVTPFLLSDAARAAYIVSGEIDLFLVEVRDGQPHGARHYLCSFAAGGLLFGIDGGDLLVPVGLLAVGAVGTVISEFSLQTLRRWADAADRQTHLGAMIVGWIEAISEAGSRPLRPHPLIDVTLAPGDNITTVQAHQRIGVARGVGWVSLDSGQPCLLDTQDLVGSASDSPVPLCASSWLLLDAAANACCESTATLVEDGRVWRGLEVLHIGLIEAMPMLLRLSAVDEANRLQARLKADTDAEAFGIAALAATAPSRKRDLPVAAVGAEPLFAACRAVGRAAGIPVRAPAQRTGDQAFTLDAILRANRLRKRQVALEDSWWRHDVGSFLLVRPGGDPVAVLRRAQVYYLYDPVAETTNRLTPSAARDLSGAGFTFYEPLPDAPLSARALLMRGVGKGRADLGAIIGFGLLGGLLAIAVPVATAHMVDSVIPVGDRRGLIEMSVVLVGVSLLQFLVQLTVRRAALRFIGAAGARLQSAILDRLLRLPVGFFRAFTAGDLMTRTLAVQAVESALTGVLVTSLLSGFFTAVSIGMMIYYAPVLGAIALTLILALAGAIFLLGLLRLSHERESVRLRGRLSHILYEMSGGVAKFRLAAAEERVYGRWAIDQAAQAIGANRAKGVALFSQALDSAFPPAAQGVIFAAVVCFDLANQGLGLGALIAFLAAFGQAAGGAADLTKAAQDLMALGPMLEHARPILEATPESPAIRIDPGELSGGIEISHVDFRYAPGSPLVLQDLSLQVAPGEFVALVGPSGSGKSSLMRLLLAFEAPEGGAILFDGRNLRDLDIPAVRRQMGVVLQDSQLSPGSLLDNILGANLHLSEEAAWRAAESAGLADDIRDLPMGMQTICGNGGGLSGGQAQRVMIARALVNRPRILLFDEATSALDNRTQAIVTESLSRLRATRIVIAHRLSTVMSADRIVVMREGRIVESGAYDALVDRNSFFSHLAARQRN